MTTYLSYLNPFAYSFNPFSYSGYARNAPSVEAIRKRLESPKFVNVTSNELQLIISKLRPIPPRAPPIPQYLNFTPSNYKEEIEFFQNKKPSDIRKSRTL